MKIEIKKIHIEENTRSKAPMLIYTDENDVEWVMAHQPLCHEGGGISVLEKKSDSWYFIPKEKQCNSDIP